VPSQLLIKSDHLSVSLLIDPDFPGSISSAHPGPRSLLNSPWPWSHHPPCAAASCYFSNGLVISLRSLLFPIQFYMSVFKGPFLSYHCSPYSLSLGLALLDACGFLQQMLHVSGISIEAYTSSSRLHHHLTSSLQVFQPCYALPGLPGLPLKSSGSLHDPVARAFCLPAKPAS
jgi:hypothetical protein